MAAVGVIVPVFVPGAAEGDGVPEGLADGLSDGEAVSVPSPSSTPRPTITTISPSTATAPSSPRRRVAARGPTAPLFKRVCLRHCRSPLHVCCSLAAGRAGAWRMGAEHGGFCVGCCWALMLVLFAVGVMSVFWMAVVAAVVFAEKVLPAGDRLTPLLAVALVALGVWIAVAPGGVPHLTQPDMAMPCDGRREDAPGATCA